MNTLTSFDFDNIKNFSIDCEANYHYRDYFRQVKAADKEYPMPIINQIHLTQETTIPTKSFYNAKNTNNLDSFKDFVYPMAVRYISKNNTYVIERPPFQLDVDFRMGGAHSGASKMQPLKIWIPWTVMVLNATEFANGDFTSLRLYLNDAPLNSMEEILVPPFYPNSYYDGKICFSASLSDFNNVLDKDEFLNGNIGYIYNYVFNNYMMGGWNCDLTNFLSVFSNYFNNCKEELGPISSLFFKPFSDPLFFQKIKDSISSETYRVCKKELLDPYAFVSSVNSKRSFRYYVRNFVIFSVFTLEQKLLFISEMKNFYNNYNNSYSPSKSLINNIKSLELEASVYSSNSYRTVRSVYKNPSIYEEIVYDSNTHVFHMYLEGSNSTTSDDINFYRVASSDTISQVHEIMINYINNVEDKSLLAFCYNIITRQFSVIMNYDPKNYIHEIYQRSYTHCFDKLFNVESKNSKTNTHLRYVKDFFALMNSKSVEHYSDLAYAHSGIKVSSVGENI